MNDDVFEKLATLLHRRNDVEVAIAEMTGRPMTVGHLGEWIASQIFDIRLEPSAAAPAIDGRFCTGPLTGKTVNIKWYLKREGILDMSVTETPDYYLVLTGPPSPAASSRGRTRPWQIDAVYLFDARRLSIELRGRGVKIGTATSIQNSMWEAAEIYPAASNNDLPVTQKQESQLRLLRRSTEDVL